MPAPSTNLSSSGIRFGQFFQLADNGYPQCSHNSGTLIKGTIVPHLTGFVPEKPASQSIDFYGDDDNYAQDSLPSATIGQLTFNASSEDLNVQAAIENLLVYTTPSGNAKMIVGNSGNKGSNDPRLLFHTFRQALDTDPASATFGTRRQWEGRTYPSTKIEYDASDYTATASQVTYRGFPTRVNKTPFGLDLTVNNFGTDSGLHIKTTANYQPVWVVGVANGTLSTYALPYKAYNATHIDAWLDGTALTVSSVTSVAPFQVTFSAPPVLGTLVVLLQTQDTLE